MSFGIQRGEYDDEVSFDLRYTYTFNKERTTAHCDNVTSLIEDRMRLDNEIRRLELEQLRRSVNNPTSENWEDDW